MWQILVRRDGVNNVIQRGLRKRIQYAAVTVGVLTLCQGLSMLAVYRDHLQAYLGIDDRGLGFLLGLISGAGLFSALPGGIFLDRYGPRRMIRIAVIGMALAFGMAALAGSSWAMLGLAVGMRGFIGQPLRVAVDKYLMQLFPRNRRRVLSLNLAGNGVGSFLFPSVAEGLLNLSIAVPAVTFAMILHGPFALLAVLLLGASWLYRRRVALGYNGRTPSLAWHWRDLALPRRAWPVAAMMLLHGTGDCTIALWLPRFLGSAAFDGTPIGPGYVLSGHAAAYVVARLSLGALPEWFGRRAFVVLPGMLGGAVFMAGVLSRNYYLTAGGYVLGAFLWSAEYPTFLSILAAELPRRYGTAMAFLQFASSGIVFLSVTGMGLLVERLGETRFWVAMLAPGALFPTIGLIGLFWLRKQRETV